jgi:hypothetical protein
VAYHSHRPADTALAKKERARQPPAAHKPTGGAHENHFASGKEEKRHPDARHRSPEGLVQQAKVDIVPVNRPKHQEGAQHEQRVGREAEQVAQTPPQPHVARFLPLVGQATDNPQGGEQRRGIQGKQHPKPEGVGRPAGYKRRRGEPNRAPQPDVPVGNATFARKP